MNEGHDQPCYYCGSKTNDLAARPSLWSIPLSHSDEPGVVKWHHEGCVSKRLHERDKYYNALKEISNLNSGTNMTCYESPREALRDVIQIAQTAIAKDDAAGA